MHRRLRFALPEAHETTKPLPKNLPNATLPILAPLDFEVQKVACVQFFERVYEREEGVNLSRAAQSA